MNRDKTQFLADLAPNTSAALEEIGVYADCHRARRVSEALSEDAEHTPSQSTPESLRLPTGRV